MLTRPVLSIRERLPNVMQRTVTGLSFGFGFWAVYLWLAPCYFTAMLAIIFVIVVLSEWKNFYSPKSIRFWLMLPLYPGLPFALLIYMSTVPAYRPLLLVLFVLAFAHDTGAYIVGNIFGRHKILPNISPKKTWEGFAGGTFSALVALLIIMHQKHWDVPFLLSLVFTILMCVLFLLGDLFESKLKREVGIKDSGSLLPGHGGLLDRFDGILFAVILCFLARFFICQS